VGALKAQLKNNWYPYGMIACVAIFPVAFIAVISEASNFMAKIIDC